LPLDHKEQLVREGIELPRHLHETNTLLAAPHVSKSQSTSINN